MGKVGSSTLYQSLQNIHLPNPIFFVHSLCQDRLACAAQYYSKSPPLFLFHGQFIRQYLDQLECFPGEKHTIHPQQKEIGFYPQFFSAMGWVKSERTPPEKWKVITSVRDPIARNISLLFQTANRLYPEELDSQKNWRDPDKILRDFRNHLLQDPDIYANEIHTWFDREFRPHLGIDIFEFPFDQTRGYSIFTSDRADVLILRCEDLDQYMEEALKNFLSINQAVPMVRENLTMSKPYAQQYRVFCQSLSLPRSVCESIYASPSIQHFYPPQVIQTWIEKWSEPD